MRHRDRGLLLRIAIVIVSSVATVYISAQPPVHEGMEVLFLLPFMLGLTTVFFGDIFVYWKKSVALTVLYGSIALRYLVSPVLIAATHHMVNRIIVSPSSYRLAIVTMAIELFGEMVILKLLLSKFLKKHPEWSKEDEPELLTYRRNNFKMSILGWGVLGVLAMLLVIRGHLGNVLSHLSFLTQYSEATDDLYTYDMIAFYVLKIFFLCIVASLARRVAEKNRILAPAMFAIVLLVGAVNCMFFDHTSRTVLVELVVCTYTVIAFCFPEKRKLLLGLFLIGGTTLVATVFINGTMFMEWSDLGQSTGFAATNSLEAVSDMAELYGNGVSTMAYSFESYERATEHLHPFLSPLKDCILSLGFITLPGIRSVYSMLTETGATAAQLFISAMGGEAYILPPVGLALYYLGEVFAVPVVLAGFYMSTKIMFKLIEINQTTSNVLMKYICTQAAIVASMSIFINNFEIMINGLTEVPLCLTIVLVINELLIKRGGGKDVSQSYFF